MACKSALLTPRVLGYRLPNPPKTPQPGKMTLPKPVPVSPALPPPPENEIRLLDSEPTTSGTRSVYSLVTPIVREWMDQHIHEHPELFHQNEKTLMESIRGMKGTKPHGIGVTENRIRVAFWMEFDRATATGTNMNMARVYSGICTGEHFHGLVIRKPEKLAWILTPLTSYTIAMEEALVSGIEKLREVFEFPLYNKRGEPDVRVGELILKAVAQLDLRVKGAIIQKIQTQSLNVHAHVNKPTESMSDLDKRLEELEQKAEQSGLPPTVEVLDAE